MDRPGPSRFEKLVLTSRSCRRFDETYVVSPRAARQLVNLARLSPSAANLQPLKYVISCDTGKNCLIFPSLRWAGYLPAWGGPKEGERPTCYIIILGDKKLADSFGCDHGIAAQTILLGAAEAGLAGCMIGNIDRGMLTANLGLSAHYEILLVIALGKPKEKVVIEPLGSGGDIKYWRDTAGVHHVPKRSLDEIIIS